MAHVGPVPATLETGSIGGQIGGCPARVLQTRALVALSRPATNIEPGSCCYYRTSLGSPPFEKHLHRDSGRLPDCSVGWAVGRTTHARPTVGGGSDSVTASMWLRFACGCHQIM